MFGPKTFTLTGGAILIAHEPRSPTYFITHVSENVVAT